jgi:hypothetical protein
MRRLPLAFVAGILPALVAAAPAVLPPDAAARHVNFFNRMEPETVVNTVPNAAAAEWLAAHVPLFECPDATIEETWWFRWWALRKHLRQDPASGKFVFTEFVTRARPVSSALGHHLMEGRWLRDQRWHDDYVLYWLRGKDGQPQDHLRRFSSWLQFALWQRWMVTQDTAALTGLYDDLVADWKVWAEAQQLRSGLYWSFDVRDAMEESISGSRTKKNVRPTLNSYMHGNARALAAIARLLGREAEAKEWDAKSDALRAKTLAALWDADAKFFKVRLEEGPFADVREQIGFIPWYFHLPEPGQGYESAWAQLRDDEGFWAPVGLTTAERRHPLFRSHGVGTCEWDGAVWPFATSQTLTALANVIRDYPQDIVTKRDHFDAFVTYARSHRYDGLPYLGEYQDERTGQWLKGRDPRSYYYNHSTFADLLITGVVGLRPRADDTIEVDPLLPADEWAWFCLDNVRYHGRDVTIIWDRDGTRYRRGAGLQVLVDGKPVARSDRLERVTGKL